MNGQFPSPALASGPPGVFEARRRLVAALALSCLLHVALAVAAYLGADNRESPLSAAKERHSPRPFTASLKVSEQPRPETALDGAPPVERSEGAGLLPFSAPAYYATDQLTKRPQPLGSANLDAPEISLLVAAGKLILKLWIDETGEVIEVEVEKTDLPEAFSRTAVAAFKRLRFVPGERAGVRVGSVMRIEVNYDDGRVAAP